VGLGAGGSGAMVLQSVVQIMGRGTAQHRTAERRSSTEPRVNVGAMCNANF
jgi:hypothetical protein